jgi:hypothetical protein
MRCSGSWCWPRSSSRSASSTKETVAHGGTILYVGTKKQAPETFAEQARRVGMPYVNQQWLNGMLTNFSTVCKRLLRLKDLEEIGFTGAVGEVRLLRDAQPLLGGAYHLHLTGGGLPSVLPRRSVLHSNGGSLGVVYDNAGDGKTVYVSIRLPDGQ